MFVVRSQTSVTARRNTRDLRDYHLAGTRRHQEGYMSAGTEGAAIAGLYLATALINRLRTKGILDAEDAKQIIDSILVLLSQKVAGVSQKVAGDGGENLVFGGDWHISIGGLRWVAEEWRTVNRGLLPMSRVL